jgi:hypothetical protein
MHHSLDALGHEEVIELVNLVQIAHDQTVRRHGSSMAHRQIVIDPDVMAPVKEQLDGMTADIARAASDEDSHTSELH